MGEWKTTLLSDICELVPGFAFKSNDFGNYNTKVIKITHITPPLVNMNCLPGVDISKYNSEKLDKYIAHTGDYVLAMTGATIGKIGRIEIGEAYVNQRVLLFKPYPVIDKDYLYYVLQQYEFSQYILNHIDSESAQPNISAGTIGKFEFLLPPADVQKKIGHLLRLFDEKYEKNNKINENLEEQAQTIFKSWFVDFEPFNEPFVTSPIGTSIPKSLKIIQVSDIPHTLETGRRPKGGAVTEGIPSIGAENVKDLGVVNFTSIKYIPKSFASKMKTGKVNGYEVMLYKDGGKPGTFTPHFSMFGEGFPYDEFFINEHVFKLDFYNRGYNEFAYLYLKTDYPYHWLANNGGKAAIPGINQQDVNSIWIYAPENPKVQEFCEWVQPIFTTILRNCAQNAKLTSLRDTLLPRLISGELDVSDLDL